MIKQTIICDRCGKEMVKYSILTLDDVFDSMGPPSHDIHVCSDCKTAFHRFMENKPTGSSDAELPTLEQVQEIYKQYQ